MQLALLMAVSRLRDNDQGNTAAVLLEEVEALVAQRGQLLRALEALTDPTGHIWHGVSGECTGECKEARAAIAPARAELNAAAEYAFKAAKSRSDR